LNTKKNNSRVWLWGLLALVILVPVLLVLITRLEGTPPVMQLELASPTVGVEQTLALHVEDTKTGLRQVWVAILQEDKETVLLDRFFPAGGLLAGGSIHQETLSVSLNAKVAGLKDGPAMLRMFTQDYSWRKWGKGNRAYVEQELIIDTRPPTIEVLSQVHNLNQGGAGVVIYRLSETCPQSGVSVGDRFYPGMSGAFKDTSIYMTFIALSHQQGPQTQIQVTATDFAGNQGRVGLPYHINGRKFKNDRIVITDDFLNFKMPDFKTAVAAAPGDKMLDIFLKVNGEMRRANYETLATVTAKSEAQRYWDGAFLRLPRAANRAGYADHRTYTYDGKKIDEQTHLGIDLASLQQSPVPAGNRGKVVFADNLGIYGYTVLLDHGFGLFSMYSHLSHMEVTPGQMVQKGDVLGRTGLTGLAGGDHLHFAMLVYQTFVNPVEWWDEQWITNNIDSKLKAIH
jgi:hypothetical protein